MFLVFLCLMFPLWWGFHLFSFTGPLKNVPVEETPDDSPWVKLLGRGPLATKFMDLAHTTLKRPAPIAGVLFQYLHNEAGHPAHLMGRRSQTGWWYYFPAAFAFKSTPVELLVTLGLIVALVLAVRHPVQAFRHADVTNQVLLVAIGVFVLMLLTSKIAIGHRYLIVLYPLLAIAAAGQLFARLPVRVASLIAACLLCGQAASNAAIAPHFLAYFNAASGGPEHGSELLVDSNLDWGQDLPNLSEALRRLPKANVAISYFGTADWKAYGVAADAIGELAHDPNEYDVLAVSVTHLQGVYVPGDDPFGPFRGFEPFARAGYSMIVYELDTPEKRAAFAAASRHVHAGIAERERMERKHRAALPPSLR
ncbi:MAG: hypothetical protein M3552_03080 [Planctomycetota bacterium]|nr:hypothetical protein [Planctomycetota bacterium]